MKANRHSCIGIICVALLLASPVLAERELYVRYSFAAQNVGAELLADAELRFMAPLPAGVYQELQWVKVNLPNDDRSTPGQGVVAVHPPPWPPLQTHLVHVEAVLRMHEQPRDGVSPLNPLYLEPTPLIESDDFDILWLAATLIGATPTETARNMHRWVRRNVTYSASWRGETGARYTLEHRVGDCTELARLFAALCRAAGMPARVLEGFICHGNRILRPSELHNWVEYHDGSGWRVVDLLQADFNVDPAAYLVMSVWGGSLTVPEHAFHRFWSNHEDISMRMIAE